MTTGQSASAASLFTVSPSSPAAATTNDASRLSAASARAGSSFLRSGQLGLMTVYENHERYDASNVWFENGQIRLYDKKNKVPQMHHIDYGLGVVSARAFDGWPRDAVVDLADVYKKLVAEKQLAGVEIPERFYEIGSHAGLAELDALLRAGKFAT